MHTCGEADCIENLADALCTADSQACRPSSIPPASPYPADTLAECDACAVARHENNTDSITTVPACGACLWWVSHA